MINKLKTFAIAMLVSGATVTTTQAAKTNVVVNIDVNLTVYQQYVAGASKYGTPAAGGTNDDGKTLVDHVSTLSTKDIITGLSGATGTNFGSAAKLVLLTTFSNIVTPTATALTNAAATNALYTNNAAGIAFQPSTNSFPNGGTKISFVGTGSALITNVGGTNLTVSITSGDWTTSSGTITNNTYFYVGTNGLTNTGTIDTNANIWTLITTTFTTNSTNVIVTTYTNVPATNFTSVYGPSVNVMTGAGTKDSPNVFTDVSTFVYGNNSDYVTTSETDKYNLTNSSSTNTVARKLFITNLTTLSAVGLADYQFNFFSTAATGSNLSLEVYGFEKSSLKYDVLYQKGTNKITEGISDATTTATVAGSGYAGGKYVTNTSSYYPYSVELPVSEYSGTNAIAGSLTNVIQIIVQGSVDTTFLKNIGQ